MAHHCGSSSQVFVFGPLLGLRFQNTLGLRLYFELDAKISIDQLTKQCICTVTVNYSNYFFNTF